MSRLLGAHAVALKLWRPLNMMVKNLCRMVCVKKSTGLSGSSEEVRPM